EGDEREADDPTHDRVEPVGEERPERDGGEPERDHDGAVAQGVERPEPDGIALTGQHARATDARAGGERRRRDSRARTRVVAPDLGVAAVLVVWSRDGPVLTGMRRFGH